MGRRAGVSSQRGRSRPSSTATRDVLEPELQSRPRPGRGSPPVPWTARDSQESSPALYRQQLIGSRRGVKE